MKLFSVIIVFLIAPALAYAQQSNIRQPQQEESPSPKTRLEQFQAKTGSVIVKGFSDIGSATGKYAAKITVISIEFTDASSGAKQFGITIEVQGSGESPQKNRSYIDLDEIDSLLNGLEYISRIDKSATKLANFEATYRTKGDFSITTFSSIIGGRPGTMIAVDSGRFPKATAYFEVADLPKLRQLIQNAQATLQSAK